MIKAGNILKYFVPERDPCFDNKIVPKSIGDLMNSAIDEKDRELLQINLICKKLVSEGLLIQVGSKINMGPILHECYYCFNYDENVAQYGSYDFLVYGFPNIRMHFMSSVRPIIIKYHTNDLSQNEFDIGTYFIIGENLFVTAKHCLPANSLINVGTYENNTIKISKIYLPIDENIDLVICETEGLPFTGMNFFKLGLGNVLEECMTIGYPPIPGFDAIQVCDSTFITSSIKSTTGNVIGEENSYLDNQDYFLINARVKGGNSGGPLINKRGEVIGIITQLPAESSKIDIMGYGIAITSVTLLKFVHDLAHNKCNVREILPINVAGGFTITC